MTTSETVWCIMSSMTETPGGEGQENGLVSDILQKVDNVVLPLFAGQIIPESAIGPIGLALYTEFVTGATELSQSRTNMLKIAAQERRNLPTQYITCPVQVTISSPVEPTHKDALDHFGVSVASYVDEDGAEWEITLPPTLSHETQTLMLQQLQRLTILPEDTDATITRELPFYVRVIPREPITPVLINDEEIHEGVTALHDTLAKSYPSVEAKTTQRYAESPEALLTDDALVLGTFASSPGEAENVADIIHEHQILGTALLEWMQWKAIGMERPSFLAQSIVESMDEFIEIMQSTEITSTEQAKGIIQKAIQAIEDFINPPDDDDILE